MAPTPPISGREEHERRALSDTPTKAVKAEYDRFKTNKQKGLPANFSAPEINSKVNVNSTPKVVSKDDIPADEDLVARAGKDVQVYTAPDVAMEASLPDLDGGASAPVDLKASVSEINPKLNVPVRGASKTAEADIPVDEGSAVKDKSLIHERATIEAKVNSGTENFKTNADKERMLKIIFSRNNHFQHYYVHNEPKGCDTCEQVQQLIDHEKHPEANGCHECQLINGIRVFHKRVCPLTAAGADCLFCRAIKEHESDEGTQDCANPLSEHNSQQKDRISHVLTQISGGGQLQKGTQFIEGQHYELNEDLGEGGFGIVKSVKLLDPGKRLLSPNGETIELAAKIADMDDCEIEILQQLVHCPYIAQHYFIVDSNKEVLKKNCKKKIKELKQFKHILFMQCAEMSLKDYENRLEDSVLSLEEATTYFLQVAHGVDRAHSLGIFHNDIKSSNVLLFANSNGKNKYTAKLCDFEFARRCGFPSGRAGGTPFFQAPKTKDGRAKDIYALGIFFLEITISRTSHFPRCKSKWPEFKEELIKELKRKHLEIGVLIEACLKKKIKLGYLRKKLNEIGGHEGWWPVSSNALGL